MRQAVFFIGIMYIIIALLIVTSHCALLPDLLNGYQLLWLLWIVIPTIGISLLATPAAPDLLTVPAPKNTYEENRNKMRFHLMDIIVRYLLIVPVSLVIYCWTLHAVWASQLPAGRLRVRALFGLGVPDSFFHAREYLDAYLLAQNVLQFALVLFTAASSVTSLHPTYDLITTFTRVFNVAWISNIIASIVLQCAFFLVSVRQLLHLMDNIPWAIYVLGVLWVPVIVLMQELNKRRYRRFMEREEKWLREEFNTRLGMWSPKDVN
jgi:hypothetical protein